MTDRDRKGDTAIVMAGGGARGAYEAGVVAGLMEVLGRRSRTRPPFTIFTGSSVGAINAAWLAAHADRSDLAVEGLLAHWRGLNLARHLRLDPLRLLSGRRFGTAFARFRGEKAEVIGASLLNPTGIEELVETAIPYERLHANVDSGLVRALVIAALEIATGRTALFMELAPGQAFRASMDPRRLARPTRIESRHVLASSALPLLFPARRIGGGYYCDGGLRTNTPIAPAIRAGARRLVIVSPTTSELPAPVEGSPEAEAAEAAYPNPIFVIGKILNTLLLDPLSYDLAVLERLNQLMGTLQDTLEPHELEEVERVMAETRGMPYRKLETLVFKPEEDIARIAQQYARRVQSGTLSNVIVTRLANLGVNLQADLLSFVLFDREYAQHLIDLGRRDVLVRQEEVDAFFA
ncbi:MAG: patatin-like phospholipase family protein [Sandaracinaceae bacterium]